LPQHQQAKIACFGGDPWVAFTNRLGVNGNCPPQQLFRFRMMALPFQQIAEIVHAAGREGMFGAKRMFTNGEHVAKERFGFLVAPLQLHRRGKTFLNDHALQGLDTEEFLTDAEHAPIKRFSVRITTLRHFNRNRRLRAPGSGEKGP